MYRWGRRLGVKEKNNIPIDLEPCLMKFDRKIESVSVGLDHAFFLGNIECFVVGEGKYGELGTGDKIVSEPKRVELKVKHAFAAVRRSFFISEEGAVYGCGSNKVKQLGREDCWTPELILPADENVTEIQTGFEHTYFKGNIRFLFGSNKKGQCNGEGKTVEIEVIPQFPFEPNQVVLSWSNTFIVDEKGIVYGCGANTLSQLPIEDKLSSEYVKIDLPPCKELKASSDSFYAITSEGTFVWGWNEHFNLATGDDKDIKTPQLNESLNTAFEPVGAYIIIN